MGFFNDGKVKANLVFEMLGRPKEHVDGAMAEFVKQLDVESGIKITNKTVHPAKLYEPKELEKSNEIQVKQELFTTFAEIEVSAEKIMDVALLVFKYLPSHVEIISPENFSLKNSEFNILLNETIARLHNYDSIAKTALMHNQMLAKKFLELKGEKQGVEIIEEKKVEKAEEKQPAKTEEKPIKKTKKKKEETVSKAE
jgi:hypothetical protein